MAPSGTSWRRRVVVVDASLALVLYGLVAASLQVEAPAELLHPPGWREYVAGAAVTLPLAARRRAPLAVLVVVTGGVLAFQSLQPLNLPATLIPFSLAVFSAGVHGRPGFRDPLRGLAGVAVASLLLWLLATGQPAPGSPDPRPYLLLASALFGAVFAAAWLVGDHTLRHREHEQLLASRTAALAARTAELEVARERSARQAATEERLRIARELHDVVGHHISVIGVQASGARRVLQTDADRAEVALAAVESAARHAVIEMQRMLALLREGDERQAPIELARLDDLISEIRAAGVEVTLEADDLTGLDANIQLAAARVVQEGLTNVLRHAGPGTGAQVQVRRTDATVRVRVEDDGRGTTVNGATLPATTGSGLAGLRDRVESHGGHFTAGRLAAGGFEVEASLPAASADKT